MAHTTTRDKVSSKGQRIEILLEQMIFMYTDMMVLIVCASHLMMVEDMMVCCAQDIRIPGFA
jgi:hypothetical protein